MRIHGDYPEAVADWIRGTAIQRGLPIGKFLSNLATEAKKREEEASKKTRRPKTKREKLIDLVRENNSLVRSAVQLGIPVDEVRRWAGEPAFASELDAAKAYWVEGLQDDMRAIGSGKRHGDANALSRLLNAHHPSFGRAKTEMILRIVDPLVKKLITLLQKELGDEAKPAIEKVVAEWQIEKRKRLSLVG